MNEPSVILPRPDVRQADRLIIRKGTAYLRGALIVAGVNTGQMIWGPYKWDAWHTRDGKAAAMVAKRLGAVVAAFNPITGEYLER